MKAIDEEKQKAAVRTLVNVAIFEGVLLAAVIGVYLYTNKLTHLIAGLAGAMILSAPLYIRVIREHGAALRPTREEGDGK